MDTPTFGERLEGHKTYLAAMGFASLGIYRALDSRWEGAIEMFLVATATASLRHAISRKPAVQHGQYLEDHD